MCTRAGPHICLIMWVRDLTSRLTFLLCSIQCDTQNYSRISTAFVDLDMGTLQLCPRQLFWPN